MKRAYFVFIVSCLILLPGCFQTKEHFVINKDGSGTVEVNIVMSKAVLSTIDSMTESMMKGMQQGFGMEEGLDLSGMPKMSEVMFSKEELDKRAKQQGLNIEIIDYKRELKEGNLNVSYKIKFDDIKKFLESGVSGSKFKLSKDASGNLICNVEADFSKLQEEKMQAQQLKDWKQSEGYEILKKENPEMAERFLEAMRNLKAELLITINGAEVKQVKGLFKQASNDTASLSFSGDMFEDPDILENFYKLAGQDSQAVWSYAATGQDSLPGPKKESKEDDSLIKLHLKNGEIVEGKLLEDTKDFIKVQIFELGITYFKDEIERIDY